jgi:hypothetical protein
MLESLMAGLVSGLIYSMLTAVLWFGFALAVVVMNHRKQVSIERRMIRQSSLLIRRYANQILHPRSLAKLDQLGHDSRVFVD